MMQLVSMQRGQGGSMSCPGTIAHPLMDDAAGGDAESLGGSVGSMLRSGTTTHPLMDDAADGNAGRLRRFTPCSALALLPIR